MHSLVWQRIETLRDADGNTVVKTNLAYVQLETGMHYREGGQWKESQELIEPVMGGAVAAHGPHKVIFAENLNTAGAIDMETPDARRLRSHVLGLSYVDTASGKSVFIAELKDCYGKIVNSNQVIYSDAFKGVNADVRYTYTKGGFEQDIILRSQPPPPKDFGFNPISTRLQVFTEFLTPPLPAKQQVTFLDARGVSTTDELLDFGDMKIGAGRAFSLGAETGASAPVAKKWLTTDGRNFLVEEVALPDVAAKLESLPKGAAHLLPNKNARTAKLDRLLPRAPKTAVRRTKMLMAKNNMAKPGLVLDYVMLNGNLQDYTFKGNATYYISGNVILTRTTTIEGGAVIKYAPGTSVQLSSSVVCKTGPYRPAIFTARDDDTVGEILTGISTGNPGNSYYASTALSAPSSSAPALSYLRISYASQGLYFNYVGGPGLTVRNVQLVNCQVGIATYYCSMGIKVRNALFKNVGTVFSTQGGYSAGTPDAQHITVDGSTWLWATSHPYGQGSFKNSVFANLASLVTPSGPASVGGANNGFYNAPSFGSSPTTIPSTDPSPFQTVGAGTCYFDNSSGSAFLNVGTTTAIDTALLADLSLKTVFATPVGNVIDNHGQLPIPNQTTWSQSVQRDNDGAPDLGYHYEPLDFCASRITLGGTLTVSEDTAIGYFGSYGFRNGTLAIQGSPLSRSKMAHYSAVQEQPVPAAPWGANAVACYLLKNGESPEVTARFADISTAGGPAFSGGWVNGLNLAHSTLLAARLNHDTGGPNSHAFTNSIIERCSFNYGLCGGPGYGMKFANNLFLNSSFAAGYYCYEGFTSGLSAHNNLFSGSSFSYHSLPGFEPQISHNGYHNSTVPIPGASPVTITTLDFQTGPLGPYYYPTAGGNLFALVNAGSTTADMLGLCPFTTKTDQTREGTSQVDIGFHYVALNPQGNPQDDNSNGIPDYDETPVANPQTVTPAICRDTPRTIALTGSGNACTPLIFSIVNGPAHGTLNTVTSSGDTSADVTYTPTALYCGPDSFTFKVRNNGRDSAPATVTLSVGNEATASTFAVNTCKNTAIPFTLSGTDSCAATPVFQIVTAPINGLISGTSPNLTYTPNPGFCGTDSLQYKVDGNCNDSDLATLTFTVGDPNLVANCQDVMTGINTPITFTLTGSDACGDDLTFILQSNPNNGDITQFDPATGVITYEPDNTFEGTDTFSVSVANCGFESGWQSVTINVVPGPTLTTECRPRSIILNWTLPPTWQFGFVKDFRIYRCDTASGTCTPDNLIATVDDLQIINDPTRWQFVDPDVQPNRVYCYRVTFRHRNTCDGVTLYESPYSNTECSTTCCPPTNGPFWTDHGPTAQELAEWIMAGSGIAVVPGSATYTGAVKAKGIFGNGFDADLPLDKGVIFSSGDISLAKGPNDDTGATARNGEPGDTDLNVWVGGPTLDAAVLEFSVTSSTAIAITFEYFFASEEYSEWIGEFNDTVAIFIWPENGTKENVALVPNTTAPVAVNTIHAGNNAGTIPPSHPELFEKNEPAFLNTQFDGLTTGSPTRTLNTSAVSLSPNIIYHVKVAIADAAGIEGTDNILDSAVFIKAQIPCP